MFKILDKNYSEECLKHLQSFGQKKIQFSKPGSETTDFIVFVCDSVQQSINLSNQATVKSVNSNLLKAMNLVQPGQLDDVSEFLAYVENITSKKLQKNGEENKKRLYLEKVEAYIKNAEKRKILINGKSDDTEIVSKKLNFNFIDKNSHNDSHFEKYKTICHTFYIAKDGSEVNWKNPKVETAQVGCNVKISKHPFA